MNLSGRWTIHHRKETASTNLDARSGVAWDVFTADYQTAGRGRLDHKWISPPGVNLMMSVVLPVAGLDPVRVSTLPIAVGYSVLSALAGISRGLSPRLAQLASCSRGLSPRLKWPNDVLVGGRKVAGILCERVDDMVIAGIGVNVNKQEFPPAIASKAAFLADFWGPVPSCEGPVPLGMVRDKVLDEIAINYDKWRENGFSSIYDGIIAVDALKGRFLSVRQTDGDDSPIRGVSSGIQPDGTLDVGGVKVFAGEAHVEDIQ